MTIIFTHSIKPYQSVLPNKSNNAKPVQQLQNANQPTFKGAFKIYDIKEEQITTIFKKLFAFGKGKDKGQRILRFTEKTTEGVKNGIVCIAKTREFKELQELLNKLKCDFEKNDSNRITTKASLKSVFDKGNTTFHD